MAEIFEVADLINFLGDAEERIFDMRNSIFIRDEIGAV